VTRPLEVDVRIERVRRVLAVAGRIRDASDPIGARARADLATTSGLSREGVELALADCLEVDANDAELARLVAWCGRAPTTWVVASANVCTAAVRSIALAVATSPHVVVRPSRRDPVVASIVVRELAADVDFAHAHGAISIAEELAAAVGDEVHAYGRDETISAIARALPGGVRLRGHGTGFGVALVEDGDDVGVVAAAIARDVVRFDQRGCLSPRVVVVDRSRDAREVAVAIAAELASWRARVPPGVATAEERAEAAHFRATMEAVGEVFGDDGAMAFALEPGASLVLPPAARSVVVAPVGPEAIAALFTGVAHHVAAVGRERQEGALARAFAAIAPDARTSLLGEMQRPRLDGPVDLRRRRA
jgi:hypothetical protein